MQTKNKKNIGWLAVLIATMFILGSTTIVISEELIVEPDGTILITGIDIGIIQETEYREEVIDGTTYFWATIEEAPGEYGGFVESRDEELDAHAKLFVHTYAEEPNIGNFIHCELWLEETRPEREKAYFVTATIDTWHIDDGWNIGPILGGIIVWENQYIEYQHAGTYGIAKVLADDKTFIFRNNIHLYIEDARGENWIRFKYSETEYDDGIWFYDMPPWLESMPQLEMLHSVCR